MAGLIVRPRSRIFHGHEWVYQTEVLKTFGDPQDGDVISLKDGRDRMLGSAIYNSHSQIVARRFSHRRQALDREFLNRRIAQAIAHRQQRGVDRAACRLVWSESDGLPGLIVDQYGPHLVVQTVTSAMDRVLPEIVEVLTDQLAPTSIIERNDASGRKAEGLPERSGMLRGERPAPFTLELDGIRFELDLLEGQKTGFYLDQIDNYHRLAPYAKRRRILDCFTNQGAFALAAARAGAASVAAVDSSGPAIAAAKRNAQLNGLTVEWIEANVFDHLTALEKAGAQYDGIILDPPSFTRNKSRVNDALRGYKEIHLRALKLLARDGWLATYCCSHHISWARFTEVITAAAVDARRSLRRLDIHIQSPDHPVIVGIPETEYLKGYLFELAPSR